MRIFAIHDAAGNISEVVSCPAKAPQLILTTPSNLTMTEVTIPKGLAVADLENSSGVAKFIETYGVEVVSRKVALVPLQNPHHLSKGSRD
jgi:hypothetical protein